MIQTLQLCPELGYAALFCALPVSMFYSHLALACFSTPWVISILPLLPLALASSLAPGHLLQLKISTSPQNLILGSIMCISVCLVVMGWGIKCDKTTSKCPLIWPPWEL